jgi:hypothetical protein
MLCVAKNARDQRSANRDESRRIEQGDRSGKTPAAEGRRENACHGRQDGLPSKLRVKKARRYTAVAGRKTKRLAKKASRWGKTKAFG